MIKKATFIKSAASREGWIDDDVIEIALVGKSNVGKSSFINALVNMKKLAKTSQTPGKTQLLNFYEINNQQFRIVDCPGYGYSKLALNKQEELKLMVNEYLIGRKNLKTVCLLIDMRHPLVNNDLKMYHFLMSNNIPTIIVLTKLDKLKKNDIYKNQQNIIKSLNHNGKVIAVSSLKKINFNLIEQAITNLI